MTISNIQLGKMPPGRAKVAQTPGRARVKEDAYANCDIWVVPTSATERGFPMLIQW